MKKLKLVKNTYTYISTGLRAILGIACAVIYIALTSIDIHGASSEHYAASSRLASGKWAKVSVKSTGMQFISNSTLLKLGFSDPSKVNVYGFGGRYISENLADNHPDDLPQLPVVRSERGLWFYGVDNIAWSRNNVRNGMTFTHTLQPYSNDSWYFLSDIPAEAVSMPSAPVAAATTATIDTFTERLLYEQDLIAPGQSGRVLLGEDFRSPATRTFPFTLTDNAEGNAWCKVAFATRSFSSSSISVSANGTKLPSTSTDIIGAITDAANFMRYATSVKEIENPGNNLQLSITYQGSGNVQMARLDYIEVEYTRRLRMRDNQLLFNYTDNIPATMQIDGASATTVVWDVTDPAVPMAVDAKLTGSTLSFNTPGGLRDYIAFNPGFNTVEISAGEAVGNQDIHALPTPDLLIISPQEYITPSEKLAAHHRLHDGMIVHVLTPEQLYNEFSSGTPDVNAFRKALKMWYDRSADNDGKYTRYCLIMSRPTYDYKTGNTTPKYPVVPTWLSDKGTSYSTSYGTDDFIGMLDDTAYTFDIGSAKIHTAVGRLPVTSLADAETAVDKIIKYVEEPDLGAWRNHLMIIADDQDNAVHLQQAENVYASMLNSGNGSNFLYERLYLDSFKMVDSSVGHTYPDAKEKLLKHWNDGLMYINYIGHASTKEWGHENLLNWIDINSFSNTRLPFLYAATCEFARFDADDISGAERLWQYPSAGIIATICPSRTVYITQNGILNGATHRQVFDRDSEGKGKRIGDIMIDGKNAYGSSDDNKLRYALIGDPAMRLPSPTLDIEVESIMDADPYAADAETVIPARGKAGITGCIRRPDGSIDTDFNGILDITLYDAEMPVETYGNGESGKVSVYNDRKTKLFNGRTRVTEGKWTSTILMPSEIENNYSPARVTLYAYSDDGKEANGACDKFYVYGYDMNAAEDTSGPDIERFALNHDDFSDGELVHSSPVVLATFSDESGINLSDAGIGHKITLKLDNNTYFEDVNTYYTPDPDDSTTGSVVYPLPELAPGDHELKLTVWDNANNSSSRSISFTVGVAKRPVIYTLDTDVNPAHEKVNFRLSTDRAMAKVECTVEVFDLNGRTVWRSNNNVATDITASLSIPWDLRDSGGTRVARGIYLYRATVTSPEGTSVTASRKLAVAAQ